MDMSLTVSIDGNNGVTEGAEMGGVTLHQVVEIKLCGYGAQPEEKVNREKTHCPKFAQIYSI